MTTKINNEGYCNDCNINNNCVNCNIMIKFIKKATIEKVETILSIQEEQISKINTPTCGDCGLTMLENKSKKGPAYICPCNKE